MTTAYERHHMPGEFYDIGRRLLEVVHEGRDGELDCSCPFHGEDARPSLRFNSETGLWYCHRCHEGGNANTLSMKLTGQGMGRRSFDTTADALEREIEEFARAQSRARSLITAEEKTEELLYKGKSIRVKSTTRSTSTGSGNGSESIDDVNSNSQFHFSPVVLKTRVGRRHKAEDIDYAGLFGIAISGQRDLVVEEEVLRRFRAPTDYWESRGFEQSWIDVFELGYDALNDAHVIPIRNEEGLLCGVNVRSETGGAKYKLPPGFERKRHLYASWLVGQYQVDKPDTVVLTEGATDAIACWHVGYQGLAVYGSSVSEAQVRVLHRLGVRNVIMAFDDDEAGRQCTAETWKLMARFFAGKVYWPRHPRQRHDRNGKGYDAAELFKADPDALARTLDRVRLT